MGHRSTTAAAALIGVPYFRITYLIRTGRIKPPARDDSGNYRWTDSDIEAARKILDSRRRPSPATVGGGDAA